MNTSTPQFYVRNRYLDVVFAAPCLCYFIGPIDDGRGTELVQSLRRLSGDEPDVLFTPVLREPETTDLRGPALWMQLRDPAEETVSAPPDGAYEMENCSPGSATVVLYVSRKDTLESIADSTLRCDLLRQWLQRSHPDGAPLAVFCDLTNSPDLPELLNALKPRIQSASFVITCNEELAVEWTSEGDGLVEPRIYWCPDKALPIVMWSLAGALSARTLHGRYRNSVLQLADTMEQLADLQFDYEKLLNASQKLLVGSKHASYRDLVRRTQQLVRKTVPAKSTVLVVSKGDPELVNLENRRGLHYPQLKDGIWAGHYPPNSSAAISQLEKLRAKGAEYFLLPAVYAWWLDHYKDFGRHLSARYPIVAAEADTATIFDLRAVVNDKRKTVARRRQAKAERPSRSVLHQRTSRIQRRSRKTQPSSRH